MYADTNTRYSRAKRKAFSLIEAAIVLGIIGLVIGGIWVAVTSVNNKQALNDAKSGMAEILTTARMRYNVEEMLSLGGGAWVKEYGIVPARFYNTTCGSYGPDNFPCLPWGAHMEIDFGVGTGEPVIIVRMFGMSKAQCVNMVRWATSLNGYLGAATDGPWIDPDGGNCTENVKVSYQFRF